MDTTVKKTFKLENLDCANCAAKMEDKIRRIKGVEDVNISFMTQKLTLTADDASFDDILAEAQKVCKRIEPDCRIIV